MAKAELIGSAFVVSANRLLLMSDWLLRNVYTRRKNCRRQTLWRLFLQLWKFTLQRNRQYLIHLFHEVQLHGGLQQLRQVGKVLAVLLGKNRLEDAYAVCRQQLLLQAADGKHLAAQRDLARHGDVAPHLDLRQGTGQASSERDPGRRSILGNRSFRHMHVDIDMAIEVR